MEKRMTREEACFLESTDAGSLSELLSGCLNEAQGQQYDRQKTRGVIRKVGNKTVVFVNNFSSFLQAYSGIVEIMKGADQQYGGVAYTSLSLFFIVSKTL